MTTQKVLLTLGIALLLGAGHYCHAQHGISHPFNVTVEPVTTLEKNVPVTFNLAFALDTMWYRHPLIGKTGSVTVCMFPYRSRGDTLYYQFWPVQYDDTNRHSMDFQLTIPDNNIFVLAITIVCGGVTDHDARFFITIGDSIEFTKVLIDPPTPIGEETQPLYGDNKPKDFDRDTLTQEQLQAELDMAVDLRNIEHLRMAQEILGPISDTCEMLRFKGQYIIRMTLEQAYKLYDLGIGLEGAQGKNLKKRKATGQSGRKEDASIDPDTLTQEQLQTEYEVYLDLRDSSQIEIARKILGEIPDSCIIDPKRGAYKIKTTLENLFRIGDEGIGGEFVSPPPWDPRYQTPNDTVPAGKHDR